MMILSFENLSDLLVDQVDFDSHSLHGYYSLYHLSDVSFKICEAAYPSSAESELGYRQLIPCHGTRFKDVALGG